MMMVNDDEDRHGEIAKMMKSMMVREIDMKMLRIIEKHCGVRKTLMSIAGWGVVPRMAPPPSQGGSTLRGRERERER